MIVTSLEKGGVADDDVSVCASSRVSSVHHQNSSSSLR